MIGSHPVFTLPLGLDDLECDLWVGNAVWGTRPSPLLDFCVAVVGRLSQDPISVPPTAPAASVAVLLLSCVAFGEIHCELY